MVYKSLSGEREEGLLGENAAMHTLQCICQNPHNFIAQRVNLNICQIKII